MSRRGVLVATAAAATAGAAVVVASRLNPRPAAAVIRAAFERGGAHRHRALEVGRPDQVVVRTRAYRDDLLLDVHVPRDATGPLPTVVWTHGGGGLSGSRTDDAGWFARLAAEGFAVVAMDYRLAPGSVYPAALHDVCDAIGFVVAHADDLGVDPARVVLGGDSAGAQMTAQLAVAATSPAYAARLGIAPPLSVGQVRGVVLACGYYDIDAYRGMATALPLPLRWGAATILWALTGSRDPDAGLVDVLSAGRHVTADFPPTVLLGGNADPLTDSQSRPMADHLRRLGVDVTAIFYEPDHEPKLPHEYQFDLSLAEAREAFGVVVEFVRRVTG